jgi:hypothetical protein
MPGRDEKKAPDRPDSLRDFPEEFEQHPSAPSRDLVRREREKANDDASEADPDSALARIEAMRKRVRELDGK